MISSAIGVIGLALTLGALYYAADRARRRWLATLPAPLTVTVLVLVLLVGELELLGAIGLFHPIPITCVAVLLAAGSYRLTPAVIFGGARLRGHLAAPAPSCETTRREKPPRWMLILVGVAATALLASWLTQTFVSLRWGIHQFDSIWYHLPWAADFARSGWTTHIHYSDVEYLTAFYPATAEMLHGLGIAFLGSDVLSPLLGVLWLCVALLAAWYLGARRGLGPATMLGAAVALGTPMVVSSQAGTADNDITAAALLLCAAALLPEDLEAGPAMVSSALAAGLALGTKLTVVPAALLLSVGVLLLAPRGRRRSVALHWLVPFVLAGGYWYVRDWVAIGTPFPWLTLPLLSHPAAPLQSGTQLSIAHYLAQGRDPAVGFFHQLNKNFGTAWPVLVPGLILAPLLCLRASRRTRLLAGVALAAALVYVVSPQSAPGPDGYPLGFGDNIRYLTPALALAFALLPLGLRRFQTPVVALLSILLVLDLARADQWSAGTVGTLTAIIFAAKLAVGILLAPFIPKLMERLVPDEEIRPTPLMTGVVWVLMLAVASHFLENMYLKGRYNFRPHISSLSPVWVKFKSIDHARVAVSGTYGGFFTYPLFGRTDTNTVDYIAKRGPHGSFTPYSSCGAWLNAVNAGHYRYLLVTPDRNIWYPKRLPATPSTHWVHQGPTAKLVYRRVVTGEPVTLWRLSGPLPKTTCQLS